MKRTLLVLMLAPSAAFADDAKIEDNSFLVEEAYNQEPGVIQHIEVMQLDLASRDWTSTFTDEWPFSGQDDQVSVSVPVHRVDGATGLGDVMLNYRRELFRDADDRLVVTPRVSLSLPSGDTMRGFGEGETGLQVQACVSIAPHPAFVFHSNVGVTVALSGATGSTVTAGQSVVWLPHARLNVLAEATSSSAGDLVLSPGLRTAIDVSSLQIVPGVAAPVSFVAGERTWGLLLYVSFEHPLPVSRHDKEI